jgi:1,2-diacylglycerol 3-alpha-glucosyltransferase
MKIVHLNGYFKDDVIYQENLLTIGQKELGHEVILLTSRYEYDMVVNSSTRKLPSGEYIFNGIKVIRIDDYLEVKKNALVLLKKLLKYFNYIKPDIIFFHDVSPHLIHGIIYKIFNPKVILHIDFHSDEYNAGNSFIGPFYHFFWRVFFKLFRSKFEKYFGVAPESVHFINKFYKIPKEDIILLPLPGDANLLNQKKSIRQETRLKYGLQDFHKVLIHTGKLPQGKETKLVLEAFEKINDENFRLLIVGSIDSFFVPILEEFLKRDERIIFLGWLKPIDVQKILLASDLMIQPGSLSHTFIEAICSGLPLILNDTPQGRYLTSQGNGRLLKIKSSILLSEIIVEAMIEKNYQSLQENAIKTANIYHYKNIAKLSLE